MKHLNEVINMSEPLIEAENRTTCPNTGACLLAFIEYLSQVINMERNYVIEFEDNVAYNANSKDEAIKLFRADYGSDVEIISIED